MPNGLPDLIHPEDIGLYWHQKPLAKKPIADKDHHDKNKQRLESLKLSSDAQEKYNYRLAAESLIQAGTSNRRINNIAQDFSLEPVELKRYRDIQIAKLITPETTDQEIEILANTVPSSKETLRNIRLHKQMIQRSDFGGRR